MNELRERNDLRGRKIAFLTANEGVEQRELTEPWAAVERAGGEPVLLAPKAGPVHAFNHLDRGDTFEAAIAVGSASPDAFAGLVLPGGVANPDQLRTFPEAVKFVRDCVTSGLPVAVICHGPWTLIDAGVVTDRQLTSWPSLKVDLRHAGAAWVDQEVVVDRTGPNTLVSSRKPDDLPAFCSAMIEAFAGSRVTNGARTGH